MYSPLLFCDFFHTDGSTNACPLRSQLKGPMWPHLIPLLFEFSRTCFFSCYLHQHYYHYYWHYNYSNVTNSNRKKIKSLQKIKEIDKLVRQVGLFIGSLAMKHSWSHLCINTISNILKSIWTWHTPCHPSTKS